MNWVVSTKVVLIADIVLLCVYDVLAIWFGGRSASISLVSYEFCRDNPVMAFAIGVVVGHILWRD